MIKVSPKADRTDPATGIVFDSKGELARWHELLLLARAGEITELRRQVKFPLLVNGKPILIRSEGYPNGRECVYRADFAYRENGQEVVEEFKPRFNEASRLRIAVAEACCGIAVRVTGGGKYRSG